MPCRMVVRNSWISIVPSPTSIERTSNIISLSVSLWNLHVWALEYLHLLIPLLSSGPIHDQGGAETAVLLCRQCGCDLDFIIRMIILICSNYNSASRFYYFVWALPPLDVTHRSDHVISVPVMSISADHPGITRTQLLSCFLLALFFTDFEY